MGGYPDVIGFPGIDSILSTFGECCLAGQAIDVVNTTNSNTIYNRSIFVPIYTPKLVTVKRMAWVNGNTVAGNVDVGIYREDGTRLVSAGSTAQSGASLFQLADVTDTDLVPGGYLFGLSTDSATANYFSGTLSNTTLQSLLVKEQATFPLPSSGTFIAPTLGKFPIIMALLD